MLRRERGVQAFCFCKTLPQGKFTLPEDFNSPGFPQKRTLLWDGGDSRDRTGDLLLARQALSQLSYIPKLSSFFPQASSPAPSKLNNESPLRLRAAPACFRSRSAP